MIKVLIAPTAFKGTLSPVQVCRAIEDGIGRACSWSSDVDMILLPLADGGDGTIEAVHLAAGGALHQEQVLGATGAPVIAHWLLLGEEALVELASSCGIAALTGQHLPLQPLAAHTFGLGQMIQRSWERGCKTINVAVGGSASTDGGMGALRALGVVFFDSEGNEIEMLGGQALDRICDCDNSGARWLLKEARLRILTDVNSPLLGPHGAACMFAPQKGASAEEIELLERGLGKYADVMERTFDAEGLRDVAGTGAAGGTAFGLAACLGAEIISGFEWVAEATQLRSRLAVCHLIVGGEGCFDEQSLHGKVLGRLLDLCAGKPLWIVAARTQVDPQGLPPNVRLLPVASFDEVCSEEDIRLCVATAFKSFFHDFSTSRP